MKKLAKYIAASIIAVFALIPPVSIKVFMTVNSTFWLWMILSAGFLGLAFSYTKADIWLKALVIYCFINCFLSRAPYLSFSMYASVVASAYFYLLCLKGEDFEPVFKTVQCIFLLFVILIVMQAFKTDTLLNFNRPEPVMLGTIGNKMVLGSFIVCLAPLLISYRKLNIVPVAIVAFISGSRGAVLALLAGIVVYILFRLKNKVAIVVLLAALGAGLCMYARKDSAVTNFFSGGRGPIWKRSIELSNKYPWQGQGISTYRVIFPLFSADVAGGSSPSWNYEETTGTWLAWRRTHNCWLQILFELGRIGFILFIGFLCSLFYRFAKCLKTEPVILAFSGMAILGTDMLIHFPSRLEHSVPVMICFLALFTVVTQRKGVLR